MWVIAKEAAGKIGVNYNTIRQQVKRNNAKFKYRYIEGFGRGGRTLEIWIDDEAKETAPKPKTAKHEVKQNFAVTPKPAIRSNRYLKLVPKDQERVRERAKIVQSYLNREAGVSYEEWASNLKNPPSRRHLSRLLTQYKEGYKKQNILDCMCDRRGRPKESFAMTQEMRQAAECYILQTKTHPSDVVIYTCMKQYFGDALPSCDTVLRYLKWYRDNNKALIMHKENPDKAKGKSLAAFGNASEIAKYKNHYWELDGTPADLICNDGIRYTIIAALDIYSRRVCLTVEPKSNSYALARNMREAILKLGVPENVVCDNGRDYKSNHFESVLQNLGINKKEVPPFSGQNKPHVERFFGTLTRELFASLEGYVGPDVATRSAIQSQMGYERKLNAIKEWKRQQHTSDSFKRAMTSKKEVMEVFVPLSADELRAWVNAWVEAVYEQRKHGGINMTPVEKYNADITPARTLTDTRMLDILLGEWREMTVGKKGIVIRRDGIDAEYQDVKLIGYIGERVYVALGQDAGEVYVYDAEMAPICVAVDESMKGKSREQIRALHKEMGKIEREKTKLVKRANELMEKMQYPAYKDVIASAAKVALPAKQTKQAHKVDIELPNENKEVAMNGDKPFFTSAFDMFAWHIEHNRENEINPDILNEQAEIYEVAKNEVEYRKSKAG